MMNKRLLYAKIEEDIRKRKQLKDHVDTLINLSELSNDDTIKLDAGNLDYSKNDTYNRLLDEGSVIRQGTVDFYIPKGEIEKAVKLLDDEAQFYINKGHVPYEFDARDYGYFTKQDLKIVDIGKGRKALDVNVHLNENNAYIQELRINKNPVGLSIEMAGKVNKQLSKEYGVEVVQDLNIRGLAIVGNVGNVNSYNFKLNGGNEVKETWLNKYLGNKKKEDKEENLTDDEKFATLSAQVVEMKEETEKKFDLYEEALQDVTEKNIKLVEENKEKDEEIKKLKSKLELFEKEDNTKAKDVEKLLSEMGEHIKKFGVDQAKGKEDKDVKLGVTDWGRR